MVRRTNTTGCVFMVNATVNEYSLTGNLLLLMCFDAGNQVTALDFLNDILKFIIHLKYERNV